MKDKQELIAELRICINLHLNDKAAKTLRQLAACVASTENDLRQQIQKLSLENDEYHRQLQTPGNQLKET